MSSSGALPEPSTGGTLTIRKGADRDIVFYASSDEHEKPAAPRLGQERRRRRCLLCGRPILLLGAPLLLVLVFTMRLQRTTGGTPLVNVSGYAALLELARSGDEILATVTMRPGSRLTTFMLRQRRLEPGSPLEILFYSDNERQKPVLLYGETPGNGSPETILQARLQAVPGQPLSVRADLAVGGNTVSLTRAVAATEDKR
jgi:hypothetical protein